MSLHRRSYFSAIAPIRVTSSGATSTSIRSWDSASMISRGPIPVSRRWTRSAWMTAPKELAISLDAPASPAAPRSRQERTFPVFAIARIASMRSFSV